jgi:D-alanyl-D-alanine dipeptidase
LVDENGIAVDMGSPLDENSDRSNPDYFADSRGAAGQRAHVNRMLLFNILAAEGFHRHPAEWWHFSRGDQMAVYAEHNDPLPPEYAIYGRADLRADIIVGS